MAVGDLVTDDWQVEYRGVLVGDADADLGSPEGFGSWVVAPSDIATAQRHGAIPGRDFLELHRVVFDILAPRACDPAAWEAKLVELETAFRPGLNDEQPLVFQLPGVAGGGKRRIWCRPRRMAKRLDPGRGFPDGGSVATVELVATDPLIYDDTEQTQTVNLPSGGTGLTWSLTWPLNWGTITNSGIVTVTNDGSFPSTPTFRVDGPVTNPRIESITDGSEISFNITVASGDYLLIQPPGPGNTFASVLLNGTASRYSTLEIGSQWFNLLPGDNELRFAAATSTSAVLQVTWRDAWSA